MLHCEQERRRVHVWLACLRTDAKLCKGKKFGLWSRPIDNASVVKLPHEDELTAMWHDCLSQKMVDMTVARYIVLRTRAIQKCDDPLWEQ